jgi:hypothetical protein
MREAGVPLEVIQRRLGHASIRTTADVYGSLPLAVDRAEHGQSLNHHNDRQPLEVPSGPLAGVRLSYGHGPSVSAREG